MALFPGDSARAFPAWNRDHKTEVNKLARCWLSGECRKVIYKSVNGMRARSQAESISPSSRWSQETVAVKIRIAGGCFRLLNRLLTELERIQSR
jgi:hypothetical protein